MFCPFYNVAFCKFRDNCSKEHAHEDFQSKMCKNKNCPHRHRMPCKYGKRCKYHDRNTCEILHEPLNEENVVMKAEFTKVQHEAKKTLEESNLLQIEITSLKTTIYEQKIKLSNLENNCDLLNKA